MRGEFIGVCSETCRDIGRPPIDDEGVPALVFCERFGEPVLEPFRPDSTTPVGRPTL